MLAEWATKLLLKTAPHNREMSRWPIKRGGLMSEWKPKPGHPNYREPRGYKWPDATPGNTIALKHGAGSERAIAERLPETRQDVIAQAPWLDDPVYASAVERYVREETVCRMLFDWTMEVIKTQGPAKVRPYVWDQLAIHTRAAARLAEPLGLDPRSRIELEKLMADAGRSKFDLARHWQEQQEQ